MRAQPNIPFTAQAVDALAVWTATVTAEPAVAASIAKVLLGCTSDEDATGSATPNSGPVLAEWMASRLSKIAAMASIDTIAESKASLGVRSVLVLPFKAISPLFGIRSRGLPTRPPTGYLKPRAPAWAGFACTLPLHLVQHSLYGHPILTITNRLDVMNRSHQITSTAASPAQPSPERDPGNVILTR